MEDKRTYYLGIDVGSVSVNLGLLDKNKKIIEDRYFRHFGQPIETVIKRVGELLTEYPSHTIASIGVTGTGGKVIAEVLGLNFTNEVVSVTNGIGFLRPDLNTVIELGGEDSKLLILEQVNDRKIILKDFSMNTACAAGTGAFLDQQASRLGVNIENEFAELALQSENPPRIAGRCSVFAKSDMIHLQQIATPDYDIVAGLCYAVARNFKSSIAKGKEFSKPVAFIGGVATNKGMVKAFEDAIGLERGELIIPEHHTCIGAIGAALFEIDSGNTSEFPDLSLLEKFDKASQKRVSDLSKLTMDKSIKGGRKSGFDHLEKGEKTEAYLGIDVGSVSTNVVVIDKDKNVLSRRYLPTAGRPIEAVRKGLEEVGGEIADKVIIKGAATTGSGRYLIGDFVGADVVRNEITAQATGAIHYDKNVDTIFEIGGQDSKFISLDNGVIIDFEMNKVCAAGTGSFLEEQAERLGINIKKEFESIAMQCNRPSKLGERCTVFIESDLVSQQQAGATKEELVSGLAYSIVLNYLNRVVGKKRIGNNIFFQGGTAENRAVVAAFEKVTGKKITVPPHNDVLGAIGAAILAMERKGEGESSFKGFDLSRRKYTISSFICNGCSNVCEIKKVQIENEKPLFYGSRCEKYDFDKKQKLGEHLPELFEERERLLLGNYYEENGEKETTRQKSGKIRIGIPRMLQFYENFPFWRTFFEELGMEIVLSDKTNQKVIRGGNENVSAEFCFPVKCAHGHTLNIIDKNIDYLFLPSIINLEKEHSKFSHSYNCPFVQSAPYTIEASVNIKEKGIKILTPHLKLMAGKNTVIKELKRALKPLKVKSTDIKIALEKAERAQEKFSEKLLARGKEILETVDEKQKIMILIGRPYNTCDKGLNMEIPKKLRDLGVLAMPIDFLPLKEEKIWEKHPNMYWRYGQKILAAAEFMKKRKNIFGVYITNFGCGPDSMITHIFRDTIGSTPVLQLEVDEHSADAGIITRLEAFLDSIEGAKQTEAEETVLNPVRSAKRGMKIYIPYMSNHALPMAAVFRECGIDAEALPEPTDKSSDLGRRYTNGKECYPCIVTTGSMLEKIQSPDFEKDNAAFFMPTASGPCRFGQYREIQSLVLKEIGMNHIPIISPTSGNSYSDFGEVDKSFKRKGWKALLAVDVLEKLVRETRPYEVNKGETDKVYKECLEELTQAMEEGKEVYDVLEKLRNKITAIKTDKTYQKPAIGMVGEIFLRLSSFSNSHLIERIENLGGEVWLAPMAEWILYTNVRWIEDSIEAKDYKEYFIALLTDKVQRSDEHKIYSPFKDYLRYHHDPPIPKILNYSAPYMHSTFGGEAILSIGKSIDYVKQGASGIANVMPFSCLPGTIVTAISKKVKEDFNNVPWINIAYDGQQDEISVTTSLEAFMYQAKNYMNSNGK